MQEAAEILFNEETDTEEIEAFLIALSEKGETAIEIAALASVMRSFADRVDVPGRLIHGQLRYRRRWLK